MQDIPSNVKRITTGINKIVAQLVYDKIQIELDNIKDLIMNGYDGLSARITDPKSKTNPAFFRKQFLEKVEEFKYFEETDKGGLSLVLPDINNFDFRGIEMIEQILDGTSGVYVEVSHEDLEKITGKTTVNETPIDPTVPKQKRVYVIRYTPKVKKQEKEILKKELVKFPFSNTPPLDDEVFGPAEEYVDDNMDFWIDEALYASSKVISNKLKGVN